MQIKIFNIPIGADESQTEEMNHFLRANKIIDVKKELAMFDGNSCWTFCITYMLASKPTELTNGKASGNSPKVDYKEILSPEDFEKFSNFRKLRKQIADSEAVPAYAVFTDAELAELAKLSELTLVAMHNIPGIGKKKVDKYGNAFILNQQATANETSGTFDGADSQP